MQSKELCKRFRELDFPCYGSCVVGDGKWYWQQRDRRLEKIKELSH